jgi:hypothetical protein
LEPRRSWKKSAQTFFDPAGSKNYFFSKNIRTCGCIDAHAIHFILLAG